MRELLAPIKHGFRAAGDKEAAKNTRKALCRLAFLLLRPTTRDARGRDHFRLSLPHSALFAPKQLSMAY